LNLLGLVNRPGIPIPWAEGDNIPWSDPDFSARMLREHLSQEHDAASRRSEKIEKQVAWIHGEILAGRPTKVLDLGCGPGLAECSTFRYASRLARMGHECLGIDYSPASIAYAREQAHREGLRCTYTQEDIRTAEYGAGYGLAMLIFGEFNVFTPADARRILDKAHRALLPGGLLLLEPHTWAAVQRMGERGASWYSAQRGLFSDRPYIVLEENFWDDVSAAATKRYWVVDATSGEVAPYAQSFQAYTDARYRDLLVECGFEAARLYPSLTGVEDESQNTLMAIVSRKQRG